MKGLKFLSCFVCLALLVSATAFAVIDSTNEVTATYENGTLTATFTTNSFESEAVEEIVVTLSLGEGAKIANREHSATVAGYEGTPELSAVKDSESQSSELTISIDATNFAISEETALLEVEIPVDYVGSASESTIDVTLGCELLGVEATVPVTFEATTLIEAEIELVSAIENTDAVSIQLVNTENDEDAIYLTVDEENSSADKIVLEPINALSLSGTTYKVVATADGYLTGESGTITAAEGGTVTISDFIPGDVNEDGDINIYDFNILCSYLAPDCEYEDTTFCDLDKDGDTDRDDVTCLLAGFNGGVE